MGKTFHRRKHKRYSAPQGEVLIYNDEVGQIVDLCGGGVGSEILSRSSEFARVGTSHICRSTINEIDGLPITIVRSDPIKSKSFAHVTPRSVGLEFNDLKSSQQKQIQEFISQMS